MAEITAQDLYNQLSPMAKRYYDQQFKNQYTPGKENILLSSQPEYNKMKAVYEAEQQVPEKSFLDSINIFGSASAAEPDIGLKLAGDVASKVSNTPGFETVLNPNGTISIVPVGTSSNLPFDSVGSSLFDKFKSTIPAPQDFYTSPTYIQKQQLGYDFPTGIMTQAPNRTSVPFGTSVDNFQGFTDKEDFSTPKKSSGIKDLFRTLLGFTIPGFSALKNFEGQPYERFTPGATIKGGIYSIGDFNQPVGLVNDFYNPNTGLNRFQRAEERFKRTGSMKDLFAASRSGAEFFRRRRELIDAQTKAAIDKRKRERDVLQFTSGTDTGPGKDTFDPSGGAGGTYDSSFDYGGSSKQAADRRSSDLGFSDIRLKENVELIGKSPSNINIYKFNYKNSPTTYQGVMAHEVPWANVKHNNGYMMVDYNRVDVEFKEWLK